MTAHREPTKLRPRAALAYSQAQLGLNLCATMNAVHVFYLYTERRGLSPNLAGLAYFVALVFDALSDPLMGSISDRARFQSGRRRPFFIAGAIPMAFGYLMLYSPPAAGPVLFAWFLGFYIVQLSGRKLYENPYLSLLPELTLDYDDRTRLTTLRQLFGTCGDIAGSLLPFGIALLFGHSVEFRYSAAIAGVLIVGGAMVCFAGTTERGEFAARPQPRLRESLRSVVRNRPFLILIAATMFSMITITLPAPLVRFLAKYWMGDENAAAGWLLATFTGSLVSYPMWYRVSTIIEKKTCFILASLLFALGSLPFVLLTPANRWAMDLLMAFAGVATIGIFVALMSALADVVDWDEERTGSRQEGAYTGVFSMCMKMAVALSMLMTGPILTWVGAGTAAMNAGNARRLLYLFALLPAGTAVLSALAFIMYPISREKHREMRERLTQAHATEAAAQAAAANR